MCYTFTNVLHHFRNVPLYTNVLKIYLMLLPSRFYSFPVWHFVGGTLWIPNFYTLQITHQSQHSNYLTNKRPYRRQKLNNCCLHETKIMDNTIRNVSDSISSFQIQSNPRQTFFRWTIGLKISTKLKDEKNNNGLQCKRTFQYWNNQLFQTMSWTDTI